MDIKNNNNTTFRLYICLVITMVIYFVPIKVKWVRRGRHCMVVGFTSTCAISIYHH